MDVRHLAFLARQPSAALKTRARFLGMPKRGLAIILANAMFWQTSLVQADGIVVNGPGTTVGQAGNGVPVINIAAPNGSGLSHNQFHDYNVGSQGVILNNSTQNLQSTQLGGYIVGNSGLNGQAAKIILNEVNGGSPSQLRGYTEVAGQSAHVIVANPYGISCNGCGFINTPQATLTTGKPVIENGQLTRYQVDGGSVAIEGAGLNATNIDRFEIITRSAKINAEIQAKNLTIVAGANDVDATTLKATARAANPADAPQLAIDSSALGGMYVGTIKLVGTEAGVGVKLDGEMIASGGDIQLDANGQLTLAAVSTTGDVNLKAQNIALTDTTYAGKDVKVAAANTLDIQKSLTAAGNLEVEGQQITNTGNLNAGLRDDGSANQASHLKINGGKLSNSGNIVAQGSLGTDLQQLDNRGAVIASQGAATLKVSDTLDNSNQGLILSKTGGLTVTVKQMDNRKGTLQATTGALNATGSDLLDNREGKILTGAGAMTLSADTLRNNQGNLNAVGGKFTATTATFDNSQGDTRAESVELTSTAKLTNDRGRIVASAGQLQLNGGELRNDNGELTALQQLSVDASSLKNAKGILSANNINLRLANTLNNDQGLIETGQTLGVLAGSVSNSSGKLRALGTLGKSQFQVGGLFSNDNGLIEIGNEQFALSSTGLSNQAGTVRHLGQTFDLALTDAGSAGGSFITNGALNLDLADWTNTSLIQAQKIGIKVGTFSQSASGKLISVENLVASGDNWQNDGSLETEGSLTLDLTGSYKGAGALKSLGKLSFNALSAELGQGAQVRSGGGVDFSVGSHLLNTGVLTATGDLLLKVASLTNQGTLGAARALTIESPTVLNEGGLIFSGADIVVRAGSFTNNKGDVYSLGKLDITAANGASANLIENISGTIESAGDMNLLATRLINRKDVFAFAPSLTSGYITLYGTDNCKGKHCEAYYGVTENYGAKITQDSARGALMAGGKLNFKGDRVDNEFSTIASGGPMLLDTQVLKNTGAGGGEQHNSSYTIYTKSESAYYTFINNMGAYNAYNNPDSASYNPAAMPFGAIALGERTGYSVIQTSGAPIESATAIIQSAGTVDITGSQQIENGFIRPGTVYAGGADRVDSTAVTSNTQALPQFNAQSAPDLTQKAVDPLALPGFSLPTGQNGLFHLSTNPQHKYLVETNPAFANLSNFVSSDYLLSRLGFDPDQAQRRLGDGLYEQRLIREAVIARTGARFIAGLDSDDAMFRYLMDNAIASKSQLNLAPGISLTSAQVAALTHDIVWMEEQVVSGHKVLVPVLYMAQANNRLASSGALIQGTDVALISGGDLKNQGMLRATNTLQVSGENISNQGLMEANERLSMLATDSIRNAQGGIFKGKNVSVTATQGDVVNERSRVSQDTQYGGSVQHHDYVDNAARIEAANTLSVAAGRDIQNSGSVLQVGGDAKLMAGRDLNLVATEQVDSSSGRTRKTSWSQSQTTQHGSTVAVGGALTATAAQDIKVVASHISAQNALDLTAGRDVVVASAANESHRASQSKKVKSSNDQIRQQSSTLQTGGDLSIKAGQDLTLVASQMKSAKDVALDANRDINLLSATDETASFYSKKSKGSFGRSKSEQRESYDSTNIASVVEAGNHLTINTSKAADGSMNLGGGRDVTVIGSKLKAQGDLMVGATGDIAVLSGVEEHGSYSKKTKSGFLGLSKSGASQLKTSATQVSSELAAGNDLVIAAGNDVRLRASEATAKNDVELRAGLINKDGDINLVSANDTAYSQSEQYKKKVGPSVSGGFLSFASAKEAGRTAQSSTSVGSQVNAERDASLQAERDINVVGSGISAGRYVSLDAGRDVNVVAAQNSSSEQESSKTKQVGIGVSGDDNGVSLFIGADRTKQKDRIEQQTAAASKIVAGEDLEIVSGRDINQVGSDLKASNDIDLRAGRNVNIDAAKETMLLEQQREAERNGLTATMNHNFGNTKKAVNGAGDGEDNVSKASSILKAIDSVSQFLAGPTVDAKFGNSKNSSTQQIIEQTSRSSTLSAGNDLSVSANNDVLVRGGLLDAGRDINIKGRDVTLDVAKGSYSEETREEQSWGGIHGGTSGGFKVGVGGSHGVSSADGIQGSSSPTQLNAGRDVSLQATNDLGLIGAQVGASRDISLTAGNELNIRSAQNESSNENNRASGGGEVGFTFGSEGVGVYASVSLGKGNLEREAERQQEAYLYAGDRLSFNSGKDTNISGATLRGNEVVGRVGGNLNVSSATDTGKVKGKEFDINVTVTVGPGAGVSGSVGYGATTGKTNWVGQQTSITGVQAVDIRTENHTQIDGALIAADNGNLKLDTGTLGFSDIAGKDKEHGYYLNVGGTYNAGSSGGTAQDASQTGKGKEGESGWSVNGWNYEKDREQVVRATVGSGEIIVRDDKNTGGDSTLGLNRDTNKAYEITQDEESRTDLYATGTSVGAVLDPGKTYDQWKKNVSLYGENSAAAFANLQEILMTMELLAENVTDLDMATRVANNELNTRRNVRYLTSKDQSRRQEGFRYFLTGSKDDELSTKQQVLVSGMADIAAQDPEKAITLMLQVLGLQKSENPGQKNLAPVAVGGAAVAAAIAVTLIVAGPATPENQARMREAVNGIIKDASSSTIMADLQMKLAVEIIKTYYGTSFPIELLDDKNRALVFPILDIGPNPSSGGYAGGGLPTTNPNSGGSQIVDPSSGSYTTPVVGNPSLGLVYNLPGGQSASDFEKGLVSLPPGERVATVKTTAKEVADSLGWKKDSRLSRMNSRDVYVGGDGFIYSVDTQHGRFEQLNGRSGAHMGEVKFDLSPVDNSKDSSGGHDLRVK
ncbi:filamentous hemagglutinin N-terminal domain-containing protein [Pseudomonas sp. P7]|uniref:hemagglutinin repeat-containing protein n=1 Tax=Pseudomonas sivasensis TaxID=1880678 RepID=UPI0015EBC6B4|nr:hemagglutinin repeat-containing protein [Pseudomonas sivasensis]MBA2921589.1 filamentous hemagglutinin N-terminal domain-containing protein [Pseudomonas sivasensis]